MEARLTTKADFVALHVEMTVLRELVRADLSGTPFLDEDPHSARASI